MPNDLPSEVTFLVGEDLSNAIRRVVMGSDVRCAVAYWGDHHFVDDKMPVREWRIICDIHAGMTSGRVLEKLGAPDNEKLRQIANLHSKVYTSSLGAIVGSANASSGGLYYDESPARLIEAGTFIPPASDAFCQVARWFEWLFSESNIVRKAALEYAESLYRERFHWNRPLDNVGFLGSICIQHDKLERIGMCFVFSSEDVDREGRRDAAEDLLERGVVDPTTAERLVDDYGNKQTFPYWYRETGVARLRELVCSVHLGPQDRIFISFHRVVERFDNGDVCHFYCEPLRQNHTHLRLPDPQDWDCKVLREIFEDHHDVFKPQGKDIEAVISASDLAALVRPYIVNAENNACNGP